MILTIRTDKPEAEVGLFDGQKQLAYETWAAHRELAETIHIQISKLLKKFEKDWHDINGIICFRGPGSFTGLRIGLSVANALAYSLDIPIVGVTGSEWIKDGLSLLDSKKSLPLVTPEYGAPVRTTKQKK